MPKSITLAVSEHEPKPLCPHCGQELTHINDYMEHYKMLSNMHVFSCPACNKVLNIVITNK